MVNIVPVHSDVTWPENEGVIGVVGVAPWATLDFCQQVYSLIDAKKDWDYPRIIVDSNSKIPSRGRHLQLGERDPSPYILKSINELAKSGATVAVVPCNTAHILFSGWGENATIPVLNIINETVSCLFSSKKRVAILGSKDLLLSGLYQHALTAVGHNVYALRCQHQIVINECISALKISKTITDSLLAELECFIITLRNQSVDTIILACTELSLIKTHSLWQDVTVIDSNEALARAALREINFRKDRLR